MEQPESSKESKKSFAESLGLNTPEEIEKYIKDFGDPAQLPGESDKDYVERQELIIKLKEELKGPETPELSEAEILESAGVKSIEELEESIADMENPEKEEGKTEEEYAEWEEGLEALKEILRQLKEKRGK